MKGIKTTITAFVFLAEILALAMALVLDKITIEELKTIVTVSTPIYVLLIGWFSKDSDKSHTQK